MKLYGSLHNRLAENKDYCDEIKVGIGMTEYLYSDREAYEVVKVIDQKHVIVRKYDHKAKKGGFANDWELISNPKNPEILMVKRGSRWYEAITITSEDIQRLQTSEDTFDKMRMFHILGFGFNTEIIMKRGKQTKYLKKNVSFGIASYYYDYEF